MATLTGFTRPSDPIESVSMASKISTDIGISVTVKVTSNDVEVTGSITESNRVAIQNSMTAYFYSFTQTGTPVSDNPDMSGSRHNMSITEHAAYLGDIATRRKNWVSGALKNDSFIYSSKAVTAGGAGVVTFYITSDGTSGGSAVFTNVYADSILVVPFGASGNYQAFSPAVSGDKKSITASVSQATNVLGILTFNAAAANGIDCRLYVIGD